MIPHFPHFKLLELSDRPELIEICQQFEPYSDFNFSSLWSWNIKQDIEVSKFEEGLVIKAPDYMTAEPILSLIASKNCYAKLKKLLAATESLGVQPNIKLIPEVVIEDLTPRQRKRLHVTEDRDNHDFILDTHDVATFEGKKYYDKRNLVNRFNRHYPQHVVSDLDLAQVDIQVKIMQVFESWVSNHSQYPEDADNERIAIQRMLRYAGDLDVKGLGVYVDDTLVAFATYEKDGSFGFISYEKAIKDFEGVYAYLNHLTAKQLKLMGCEFINFEQDLGIPGLRTAKELWRPIRFLRKYSVSKPTVS